MYKNRTNFQPGTLPMHGGAGNVGFGVKFASLRPWNPMRSYVDVCLIFFEINVNLTLAGKHSFVALIE